MKTGEGKKKKRKTIDSKVPAETGRCELCLWWYINWLPRFCFVNKNDMIPISYVMLVDRGSFLGSWWSKHPLQVGAASLSTRIEQRIYERSIYVYIFTNANDYKCRHLYVYWRTYPKTKHSTYYDQSIHIVPGQRLTYKPSKSILHSGRYTPPVVSR